MSIRVEAAGRTHVGLVRRRNEDSLYVGEHLFAVADGLGGHVAGNVASTTAIEAVQAFDQLVEAADLPNLLGHAVAAANTALRVRTGGEPKLTGMGTTLVALLRSETTAVVANVGDSRVYLRRDGRTLRITEDHVYGRLVAEAASVPNLPGRLARFLDGRTDGRSPDLTSWNLRSGDRFLLCSDGLTAPIPDNLIHGVLTSIDDPGEAADQLVSLAVLAGGPDNITVVIIDFMEAS